MAKKSFLTVFCFFSNRLTHFVSIVTLPQHYAWKAQMAPPASETRIPLAQSDDEGPPGHRAATCPGAKEDYGAEENKVTYPSPVIHFLHKLSAVLFTILGLLLFGMEVLWRQGLWMPWSQVLLTTIPTPLLAVGLLYGGLSIVLSAREGDHRRAVIGTVIGLACLTVFAAFAMLRLWPLS